MTTIVRTKEEVLKLVNQYREKLGFKARDFPISDQWGNNTTIAGLLIQDPEMWQGDLTDDMNHDVYNTILGWMNRK